MTHGHQGMYIYNIILVLFRHVNEQSDAHSLRLYIQSPATCQERALPCDVVPYDLCLPFIPFIIITRKAAWHVNLGGHGNMQWWRAQTLSLNNIFATECNIKRPRRSTCMAPLHARRGCRMSCLALYFTLGTRTMPPLQAHNATFSEKD